MKHLSTAQIVALMTFCAGPLAVAEVAGSSPSPTAGTNVVAGGASAPDISSQPRTEILAAKITPSIFPPGSTVKVQFNWNAARPLKHSDQVFVHFIGKTSGVKFTDNHTPDISTDSKDWQGKISYLHSIKIPATMPADTYQVAIGFYPPEDKDQSDINSLAAGPGVTNESWAPGFWVVGTVTVDPKAPLSKADTDGPQTLDLRHYKRVFNEDFTHALDVSPWGPGTRWTAHTPWNGDFGDAKFTDPEKDFPFKINKGVLSIQARQTAGKWSSGLLCSCDPEGEGFSQKYGYFECRAKMPAGVGVWPAFWLASQPPPAAGADVRTNNSWDSWMKRFDTAKEADLEIDVIEFYGHDPAVYNSTITVWRPEPHHSTMSQIFTRPNEVSSGFHNYGVMVEPDHITMYFDGVAVWQTNTPKEHTRPLMMLVNLALGSGWPIDKVPNPSTMYVQYIRAYVAAQ